MFLAGMFAISGAFVSCDDSDDTDGVNKLEVTPSTDISFKADGNEDVVLTVVTDADKWSVEKTDWITVKQNGNKLTVNAEANTTGIGASRTHHDFGRKRRACQDQRAPGSARSR